MIKSLLHLCFDVMESLDVKPDEVGIPEPVGIQYYRRLAEKSRDREVKLEKTLDQVRDEHREALNILEECVEDGDEIRWLLERVRDGTFRCKECGDSCLIQVADEGKSFYPSVVGDEFFSILDGYCPKVGRFLEFILTP